MTDWNQKLAAYLHDPPEKVLDLAWHRQRAEAYQAGLGLEDTEFSRECDHTAAAADRLPWPVWNYLECAFDGQANHFKHPLGGKAKLEIHPYSHADIAHHFASLNRPQLTVGDDRAQFFAFWRLWRWWASDQKDARLAFLPADTRLPDHTIWAHNSIVSALQACVGSNGLCQPAFLLFQIGPVQEYIAQARRTLDLWSGSYLLSYLAGIALKHIALNFGPDNVIFPNLVGQPIFDLLLKDEIWERAQVHEPSTGVNQNLWDCFGYEQPYGRQRLLTASLPNRFLAVLPAERARDVARELDRQVRQAYLDIAGAVWLWSCDRLPTAGCWTEPNRHRFDAQNQRLLDTAWQVLPWTKTPAEGFRLTEILPHAKEDATDQGPRAGLWTILEMARTLPPAQRDVRNYQCAKFPPGTVRNGRNISGWKDRTRLEPGAQLDNPGAAWSALYQLVAWQLDAVRQTRSWKAWASGGWEVGREQNKDSLNGKEEALLDLRAPRWTQERVDELNAREARIPNLFKFGELLGASSLIKRLWPSAWLQEKHRFQNGAWRMPDTRHIADGRPFARSEDDPEFDSDAEAAGDEEARKYFAVLAFDGDDMGKWVSGLHPRMPALGDQLADYVDPGDGRRKGAKLYFEQHGLGELLKRKRPLNPSFHLQFSEMLGNFSNFCVRRIVEAYDGRLIYSGGDDVLAILPAAAAIPCARALRAAFQGDPDALNHLSGAWRFRAGVWQKEDPRLFDLDQPGFVRLHAEAPTLEGEPKKFPAMVPGPAADASAGIAIAHFKAPLQDVVRAAQEAEKRAKREPGKGAVAVTLVKRSGETIEWSCRWSQGGVAAYDTILEALRTEVVSGRFPHRVVELINGYLADESRSLGATEPSESFALVSQEVLRREVGVAAERQRGPQASSEKMATLQDAIAAYLQSIPDSRRKVRDLIGLCQTVAFIARTAQPEPRAARANLEFPNAQQSPAP